MSFAGKTHFCFQPPEGRPGTKPNPSAFGSLRLCPEPGGGQAFSEGAENPGPAPVAGRRRTGREHGHQSSQGLLMRTLSHRESDLLRSHGW